MSALKTLLVTSSSSKTSASSMVATLALERAGYAIGVHVDTVKSPPPAYGQDLMAAVFMGDKGSASLAAQVVSDDYIEQVLAADVIVAAIPMHNFGVPSGFKAWMDQIARPGKTFAYGADGPKGLLAGKKMLVVLASGGDYSGSASGQDHAASHAKTFFEFLGLQVEVVRAPSQAGAGAEAARVKAAKDAEIILRSWLA